MSLLSLTFHTEQKTVETFDAYCKNELKQMIENLMQVEKYYFSEVASTYIENGKNYNLLLIFDDEVLRSEFITNELQNIKDHLAKSFCEKVMIFQTELDLLHSRI